MKTVSLLAIAVLLSGCPGQSVPTPPIPSPSPEPSVVIEPIPSPSPSPSRSPQVSFTASANRESAFYASPTIQLAQGETRGVWMRISAGSCPALLKGSGLSASFFRADPMTAAKPSYLGAPPTFYDKLVPTDAPCAAGLYFVDVSGLGLLRVGDAQLELKALPWSMPAKPSMPLYVGLNPSGYSRQLGVDSHVSKQGPVIAATVALMRAHLAEPFSQFVTAYPRVQGGNLLLDEWKEFGASFRQLVLDGAIAPPCLVSAQPPAGGDTLSDAYLAAVQAGLQAGTLPPGSWAYGWDEDQYEPPAQALARINRIKSLASLLNVRATREQDAQFTAVDSFIPIADLFRQLGHVQAYQKPYGLYTSCMAQGSCNGPVRNPSGAPMLVADAPAVHPLAFPVMSAALGSSHALYYSATEAIGTGLNYASNGNGDGQLLYVGTNSVYPSVRLKLLREGMFMVEYYRRKPAVFVGLVQSGIKFSQDYSAFEAARAVASF
jgi:hypothetical protein